MKKILLLLVLTPFLAAAQTARIPGVVLVVAETASSWVQAVETVTGSNPKHAPGLLIGAIDIVVA